MPKTDRAIIAQSSSAAPLGPPAAATLHEVPARLIDRYLGPRSLVRLGASSHALRAQVHDWLTLPIAQRLQAQQRRQAQAVTQALGSLEIEELPDDVLHHWLDEEVTLGQCQQLRRTAAHAARQDDTALFSKVVDKVFGWHAAMLEIYILGKEGGVREGSTYQPQLGDPIDSMQRMVAVANAAKFWPFRVESPADNAPREAYRACCVRLPTLPPAQEAALLDTLEAICYDVPSGDLKQEIGDSIMEYLLDAVELGRLVRMLVKLMTTGPAMSWALHETLSYLLGELAKRPGGARRIAQQLGSLLAHPNLYVATKVSPRRSSWMVEKEMMLVDRLLITDALWRELAIDDTIACLQSIWRQVGARPDTIASHSTAYWLGTRARKSGVAVPARCDESISGLVTPPEAEESTPRQCLRERVIYAYRLTDIMPADPPQQVARPVTGT